MKVPKVLICGYEDVLSQIPGSILNGPSVFPVSLSQVENSNQGCAPPESIVSIVETNHLDLCVFLSPFYEMRNTVLLCMEKGLRVTTIGPIPFAETFWRELTELTNDNKPHWRIDDDLYFDSRLEPLKHAIHHLDFGLPVYYREISFGGLNLLSNWWKACQLYKKAELLLGSSIIDLHVSANQTGNKIHITLTFKLANRSNGHIICTNSPFNEDGDLLLIGTGGVLDYDGLLNRPLIHTHRGIKPVSTNKGAQVQSWWEKNVGEKDICIKALPEKKQIQNQGKILEAIHTSIRNRGIIQASIVS